MKTNPSTEALLRALCLTTMAREYETLAQRAEKEPWTYVQYLHNLCERESDERSTRRIQRRLKLSCLPEGKTLDALEHDQLPLKVRRQIPRLLDGGFVEKAENILAFGLPGRGKTHLLCAIARELVIHRDCRVLFTTAFHLVQRLLIAKKDLTIEDLLRRLDRFDVILLDDIGYVQQDRDEMEVLFTFLSERYERRSLMISSNLVFSEWDKIFKNPMTTAAAIDRLVHHSIILELDGESYRARHAQQRSKGREKREKPA
jgi:DNA replication protein DnaC